MVSRSTTYTLIPHLEVRIGTGHWQEVSSIGLWHRILMFFFGGQISESSGSTHSQRGTKSLLERIRSGWVR